MNNRAARVRLDGKPVGKIEENGDEYTFTYAPEWLSAAGSVPVSVTLPLRPEPYVTKGLHPFFENLLPEGWLLELTSKRLKVSKNDPFGILLSTCSDCIGAVEIEPLDAEDS